MILFWLLTAAVSGLAALLILLRAARAEQRASAADPELALYRRQLDELDELADRGLIGGEEHRSARAEAARRLIGEAEREKSGTPGPDARSARWMVTAAAVAGPILALLAYLALGSPGLPDQPFKPRLKAWQEAARSDPRRLSLPEVAAVLEQAAKDHPKDLQPLIYLAGAEAAEGDPASAVRTLQKATLIAPNDAQVWTALGEAIAQLGQGQITDDARQAFERAHALDPAAPAPRYYLAQGKIAAGHAAEGLKDWQELAASLPPGPDRTALEADIAAVTRTGRLPEEQQPASGAGDQAAFIQSMVDRLAARLKAQPDDPEGWARLIRAYGVLGQTARRDAAVAEVRRLFKDRPDALKTALSGEGQAQ
jgi:cytochrome c-type biogenesis protein CcmH